MAVTICWYIIPKEAWGDRPFYWIEDLDQTYYIDAGSFSEVLALWVISPLVDTTCMGLLLIFLYLAVRKPARGRWSPISQIEVTTPKQDSVQNPTDSKTSTSTYNEPTHPSNPPSSGVNFPLNDLSRSLSNIPAAIAMSQQQMQNQAQSQQPLILMVLPCGQMMSQTSQTYQQLFQAAELLANIVVPSPNQQPAGQGGGTNTVPDAPANVAELKGSYPGDNSLHLGGNGVVSDQPSTVCPSMQTLKVILFC